MRRAVCYCLMQQSDIKKHIEAANRRPQNSIRTKKQQPGAAVKSGSGMFCLYSRHQPLCSEKAEGLILI